MSDHKWQSRDLFSFCSFLNKKIELINIIKIHNEPHLYNFDFHRRVNSGNTRKGGLSALGNKFRPLPPERVAFYSWYQEDQILSQWGLKKCTVRDQWSSPLTRRRTGTRGPAACGGNDEKGRCAADVIDIPGTSSFPHHPGSTAQQFLTVVQPLLKEPMHTV